MADMSDMKSVNQQVIEQYRANDGVGELGPVHFDRLLLLTTTGRHSGKPHTVPLGQANLNGEPMVFASNNGSSTPPAWYLNLDAEPTVTVEIGADRYQATADVIPAADRDRAYATWISAFPPTADHEDKAGRTIPLVVLHRD
jgi:deazaflavin-dependent oxidoreductase (nitroreductase family)